MIKRRANLPGQIYAIFDEEWREKNGYDLEVAYWRKCWNVRAIIFDVLNIYDGEGWYQLKDSTKKQIEMLKK